MWAAGAVGQRRLTLGAPELLDAVVAGVHDEDVSSHIDGDADWRGELPVHVACRAPFRTEDARVRELLDAVVAGVGDVDVSARVDGDPFRGIEEPVAGASAAPLG